MSRLKWDQTGERFYETGVRQVVLYTRTGTNGAYENGVAWNGVTAINENPTGGEPTALYADDIKYLNLVSVEEFEGSIEAYTYPDEFGVCDGSAAPVDGLSFGQQDRKEFALCYRTAIGNDTDGSEKGYKLHIVYGCLASPSDKSYETIDDSPDAITFSWDFTTTPVETTGYKPVSHVVVDSTKVTASKLTSLEEELYGVDAEAFSASSTYAVGDYCTHETKTYRCTTAITTAAAWDATKWTEVTNPGPHIVMPDGVKTILS